MKNMEITIEKGQVVQSNFDDYRIARLRDAPEINVTIVDSTSTPSEPLHCLDLQQIHNL